MANESASGPSLFLEQVDLDKASPAFRRFYHVHFVDTLPLQRSEEGWDFATKLKPEEITLARRLVRANLRISQIYRDSAALLNDRDAIPVLYDMLAGANSLSERINIARPLWILERSSAFPPLLDELVRSRNTALKHQHIFDLLLLADDRVIDHLFTMARDQDESVRDLALFHLTALSRAGKSKFWNRESDRTQNLTYFEARRHTPSFRGRVLKELRKWHEPRPLL